MKRIFKLLVLIVGVLFFCGCTKNYKAITYTKFNEVFIGKEDYITTNDSDRYEDKFERFIQSSGKNTEFYYYEFKTEKEARNYMSVNYKDRKYYSYKDKKKYITVKCTKGMYFYAIQIDKIIIIGSTPDPKYKAEVKNAFKELGY